MHDKNNLRFVLLMAVLLYAIAAACEESSSPFVPKSLYSAPEVKRDLVIRIERFPTCKDCPWYEIRIFDDSTDMFIGKDAVRELGVRGTYMNTPKVVAPGLRPSEVVEHSLRQIQAVQIHLHAMWNTLKAMQRNPRPRDNAAQQLIEIESFDKNVRRKLRFYVSLSGDEHVRSLLADIENLSWLRRVEPFAVLPRPSFFSDRNAAIYVRYQLFPPEECDRAVNADDLIIVLYTDGRMYAEQIRALGPKVSEDSAIPKIWLNVGTTEVERLRSVLLYHAHDLAATQLESDRTVHSPSAPPGQWQVRERSRLYVKGSEGKVHDLSAALISMSQPETKGLVAVRNVLFDTAQKARQNLPPAVSANVSLCKDLPPRR